MKKVEKLLNKFLEKKVKIKRGDDLAEANLEDVRELESLIKAICKAKWQTSYDGVTPVQVMLINRTTHQAFHYRPIPYIKDDENKGKYQVNFEERMRIATLNNNNSSKELDNIWSNQESALQVEKAILENRYCQRHGSQPEPNTPCPLCSKKSL